jgi:hypothetical protein
LYGIGDPVVECHPNSWKEITEGKVHIVISGKSGGVMWDGTKMLETRNADFEKDLVAISQCSLGAAFLRGDLKAADGPF